MKKTLNLALHALRNFLCCKKRATGLPQVRVVFPAKLPAAGFQLKLLDGSGNGKSFCNSAEVTFLLQTAMDGKEEIAVGLNDALSEEMWQMLQSGTPIIARVTHLYEIRSVEREE